MTYSEKLILSLRLDRAEHLIRADIDSLSLAIEDIKLSLQDTLEQINAKADDLGKQADLLSKAQTELWRQKEED